MCALKHIFSSTVFKSQFISVPYVQGHFFSSIKFKPKPYPCALRHFFSSTVFKTILYLFHNVQGQFFSSTVFKSILYLFHNVQGQFFSSILFSCFFNFIYNLVLNILNFYIELILFVYLQILSIISKKRFSW